MSAQFTNQLSVIDAGSCQQTDILTSYVTNSVNIYNVKMIKEQHSANHFIEFNTDIIPVPIVIQFSKQWPDAIIEIVFISQDTINWGIFIIKNGQFIHRNDLQYLV